MSVEIIPVKVPGLWPITREAGSIKVAGTLVRDLILERFPELPADRKLTCRADFLPSPAFAALVALGCHLCRNCQSGTCNWGIATQRPELVARLDPEEGAERLVNLMTAWRHEIKELMGGMGINSIEALRGNRLMLRGVGLNAKELEILGIKHAGE